MHTDPQSFFSPAPKPVIYNDAGAELASASVNIWHPGAGGAGGMGGLTRREAEVDKRGGGKDREGEGEGAREREKRKRQMSGERRTYLLPTDCLHSISARRATAAAG